MSSPTVAAPLLDEQICFALYSASRAITARYRELLAPLGLTYPQYLVLMVLWHEGSATVSHLGERLELESGTLSPLLKRLESAGLITRQRILRDERSVEVALTDRGSALRIPASEIPASICAATGLDESAIGALRDELSLLAGSVRASL